MRLAGVEPHVLLIFIAACYRSNTTSEVAFFQEFSKAPEKTPSSNQKLTSETGFQEMLNELPKRVSKAVVKNLSVPIAFVCLLHLANEKASAMLTFYALSVLSVSGIHKGQKSVLV